MRTAPLDADPALLPGGTTRLVWRSLSERQRFESCVASIQARHEKIGTTLSREEAVLTGLNRATWRRTTNAGRGA